MNTLIVSMLISIALISLFFRIVWLFSLFLICISTYLVAQILKKATKVVMQASKTAGSAMKKEAELVSKANTNYPAGAMSETFKEVGRKAGEQVFNEYGLWSSGETAQAFMAKLGKSTKGFISRFLSLFK